jgi:uncharacterized protein (TIGR02611 family)
MEAVRKAWRKVWRLTVGSVVILAGIAMCVLPGPGIATIVLGLVIMAPEFEPAQRALDWMKERFGSARDAVMARRKKDRAP